MNIFMDAEDMKSLIVEELFKLYLEEQNRELQQRINKSIELIKQYDNTFIEMNLAIKLIEILEGGTNEKKN